MSESRRSGRGSRRAGWSRLSRPRRWTTIALFGVGLLVTIMSALLVSGARVSDARIEGDLGETTAEVLSVTFPRTLIRYNTPEGAVHSPQTGVLYPAGLEEEDLVRVEYDREEPDLVRVAGRGFELTLLPTAIILVSTWAVLLTAIWLICRRRRPTSAHTVRSAARDAEPTATEKPATD